MIKIGAFDIVSVVNGTVRLDGGAMFGVVPKVLWQSRCDVDDQNRILLATRTLIAVNRTAKRVILVDTGCGTKWGPEQADRYAITHDDEAIPGALRQLNLNVRDVTDIVVSHLHFDHNGGLTDWKDQRKAQTTLRYPHATHWIHRRHWAHARNPSLKDRASFVRSDFEALDAANVLRFVDSAGPGWIDGPLEGLNWFVSTGHTPYQLHPVFEVAGNGLIFSGDIVPTSAHLGLGWVMAYDVEPVTTIQEKQAIYERCVSEGLKLAFPHDPNHGIVKLGGTAKRPELVPI